ncbi:P-loop containing nucleoside triphosphate hydrolase protein [Massarina eburnea CBS 473.64]|uniref:P-loop containing nucleoside triphosphate hydrolase protein n=1 Tax=Massarina eburnea CBS 473.64 TaxID=1395130 RepID=A0A6A6S351_9PLEO|nr:P-loop containing nucleoside triphosphate hydrolase protein [Massarina eburnea CBS 473.64]
MDEQVDRLVAQTWGTSSVPLADQLANRAVGKFQDVPRSKRYLIAVSGIPGSGKTTLAAIVSNRLNELYARQSPGIAPSNPIAAFIPMDGYHLSREQLDAMPDPLSAHARRGAAFTFDGHSFLSLVKELREPLCPETRTLFAPSFDHAMKDPVANDIAIRPSVRLAIFEGNYLSLSKTPWKEAAELMDELWFVRVSFEVARSRLVHRHIKAGLAKNEEEAGKRADENDLVNGKEIVENRLDVHEMILSNDDGSWAPERQGVGDGKDVRSEKY